MPSVAVGGINVYQNSWLSYKPLLFSKILHEVRPDFFQLILHQTYTSDNNNIGKWKWSLDPKCFLKQLWTSGPEVEITVF